MEIIAGRVMKLHIGSGHAYWPGWVNVDMDADADVDADIRDLPFDDNSADEIHGIHVFEHLHRMDAPKALREWRRVLKDGGRLVLEMPSLDKMIVHMANGEKNLRMTLFGLYGDPQYGRESMCHRWGWSEEELRKELESAGFEVKFKPVVFHIATRDMRVEAIVA